MNQANRNLIALAARVLLAGLFLFSGFNKIFNFAATQEYMASAGVPATAVLLVLTIVLELVAGTMILIGYQAMLAAGALIIFLIPVTLIFHNPLAYTDPLAVQHHTIHLVKNLAIIGGLLHIMAFGGGAWSVQSQPALGAQFH